MDRKVLLREALQAAVQAREASGFDQFEPLDPYLAAQKLSVKVVFLTASMEGFYLKGPPGRILLSSSRPVARRNFTCAHELGHHWFGHGSTLDELKEDDRSEAQKPEEVLANGFASFLLMPTIGIRSAFARRGWKISSANAVQMFTVACEFGVGYRTLINHLHFSLREITSLHKTLLEKSSPIKIRQGLLSSDYDSLVVADNETRTFALEVEVGAAVLLPKGSTVGGGALLHVSSPDEFELFKAMKRGVSKVSQSTPLYEVRVMPKLYEGAALNRFLEDPDDEL
jgi:Zn-dependent peptidase ImmA (M78 family)